MQNYGQFNPANVQSILQMLSQMIPNYGALNNPHSPQMNGAQGLHPGYQNSGGGGFHFSQPQGSPQMTPTPPQPYSSQDWMNGNTPPDNSQPAPQPTGPQWMGMDGQTGLGSDALTALGNYQP